MCPAVALGSVFAFMRQHRHAVDFAREAGATVVIHPWEGHARQKNWAIDNVPADTTWLLFLDADEFLTPALRGELVEQPHGRRKAGTYD